MTPSCDAPIASRKRSLWKALLLTALIIVAILGSWLVPMHVRYRQQMEAVAVVERLGGSVYYDYDAPEWLQRLQPGLKAGPEPLGSHWVRGWLYADVLVDYSLVINFVDLDNGPGLSMWSNLSGEQTHVDPIAPTDADLVFVAQFTKLESLLLRETPVGDNGLNAIRALRKIKTLYLSFSEITDESLEVVAGFEDLETLRLVGTKITDAGLGKLTNLKYLTELDVRGTQVTEAGIEPFRGRTGLELSWDDPKDRASGFLTTY